MPRSRAFFLALIAPTLGLIAGVLALGGKLDEVLWAIFWGVVMMIGFVFAVFLFRFFGILESEEEERNRAVNMADSQKYPNVRFYNRGVTSRGYRVVEAVRERDQDSLYVIGKNGHVNVYLGEPSHGQLIFSGSDADAGRMVEKWSNY